MKTGRFSGWFKGNNAFILIFLALLAVFFYKIVIMRSALLVGDNLVQSFPWLQVYSESLKKFQLPFWTNGMESGFPVMGEGQVGGFYPLNLLFFFLLPFRLAYNWILIVHFFLAGLFTYFFTKKIGADDWGAALAAFLFCFGSAFANFGYHLAMVRALVWIPLILLLFEHYFEKSQIRYMLIASVIMGFQFLSGSVQMAVYSLLFYFIYFIYRIISDRKNIIVSTAAFFIFTAIAAVMFIPQYLITVPVIEHSGRISSLDFSIWGSLNPISLFTTAFPGAFAFKADIAVENFFLGALTLLFLIAAFAGAWKNRKVQALTAILCVALFCSLGRLNPLYVLILKITKFYTFRAPARFIFFGIFAASIISGLGFTEFFKSSKETARRILKIFFGFLLFCTGAVLGIKAILTTFRPEIMDVAQRFVEKYVMGKVYHRYDITQYMEKLRTIYDRVLVSVSFDNAVMLVSIGFVLIAVIFGVLLFRFHCKIIQDRRGFNGVRFLALLIIVVNLFCYSFYPASLRDNEKDFTEIDPAGSTIFSTVKNDGGLYRILPLDIASGKLPAWATPNVNMCFGVDSAGGYSPLSGDSYRKFLLKFQAVDDSVGIASPDIAAIGEEDLNRLRLLNVKYIISPERLVVKGLQEVSREHGVYLYWLRTTYERAYFSDDLDKALVFPAQGLEVLEYRPGYAEFSFNAPTDSFFVFSESHFPGWKAWVDGEEVKIESFLGVLQAVRVTKGKHRAVFKYSPLYALK